MIHGLQGACDRENSSLECMRSGGKVKLSAEDLLEDLLRMHEGALCKIYCEEKSQRSQLQLADLPPPPLLTSWEKQFTGCPSCRAVQR